MVETASGMLNSIGLQGPGIDGFLARDLPWLLQHEARPIVSIAGSTLGEYAELARRVGHTPGVAAIEVNISCPNVENRGLVFACDPLQASRVMAAVRGNAPRGLPVLAKLSPDVTSIAEIAESVLDAGADGLVLINTLLGLSVDLDTMRPALGGVTGGLSGPAIKPVALHAVYHARAVTGLPIVGLGGVQSAQDCIEMAAAGASVVGVGTALFRDPGLVERIVADLPGALAEHGVSTLDDIVGAAHQSSPQAVL
jgi:dihydroorotate dehydrogenase (NAD+) catalytic subunit